MKYTLIFSAVGVSNGPSEAYGSLGQSGHFNVGIEAPDWKSALTVAGSKLTRLLAGVPDEVHEQGGGRTVWDRMKAGPRHEEARRLAQQWLEANDLYHPMTPKSERERRLDSLTGLIEGLLGQGVTI